jgi:hypothetical protein
MKQALLVFLLMSIFVAYIHAQAKPDTIYFTLNKQHNICVKARINQSDTLILMYHSSATGVTLTKEALKKKIPLGKGQSTEVHTWGGNATSEYSEGNTLTINDLRWDSIWVFINENSGEGTDGKFGFDFFAGKILEIDYDHQRMVVHSTLPKLPRGYKKNQLFIRNESTFILGELKIGRTVYRDTFMFHTGYGGAVLLDPKIGERYGMQAKLRTISTSELKDAYGNVFKIETKQLPKAKLGGRQLKNIPLSFAARSADIPMKVFGNGLLRRFNVVFDFQENLVYMKPNGNWAAAY